jgi:hypothetical protein
MRSPSCLCVCPPYQLLTQLVDFYEIQYRCHAIEDDLDVIIFNAITVIIPKWRTYKILGWIKNLHLSTQDHKMFILTDLQGINRF